MPIYLIKNNFKLMLRSKWIIALMIIGPTVTVACLSSAFHDMMKNYESAEEFTVGYYMAEDSMFAGTMEVMKEYSEEAGITFQEFPTYDAEGIMSKNECMSFVNFGKEDYTIYTLKDHEIEGMTTEYFLNSFLEGAVIAGHDKVNIPTKQLESMPNVEAHEYYSMVYIVYFIWCCLVSLATVVTEEKKNGLYKRFGMSTVSDFGFYMAKVLPCILVTVCELTVSVIAITYMNDLHWSNLPAVISILFLNIVAGTTFGVFLMYLFDNLAIVIVTAFTVVWVLGFFGGSFETYMYSFWPESLKRLTPFYHSNRALVECYVTGNSDYVRSCVLYLAAISLVCMAGGFALAKIRKGKAA